MKQIRTRVVAIYQKHRMHMVYGAGLIIIGVTCFLFGALKGAGLSTEPIIVEKPRSAPVVMPCEKNDTEELREKDCMYVGSIKGKKYYPPSCSYAAKIKKENLRCFASDVDAREKGYEKSTSCK